MKRTPPVAKTLDALNGSQFSVTSFTLRLIQLFPAEHDHRVVTQ